MDPVELGGRVLGSSSTTRTSSQASVSSFMIPSPGAELGPIPEAEDVETTPPQARTDSRYSPAGPSSSGVHSHVIAPAAPPYPIDTLSPLPLKQRRGFHAAEGDHLDVEPLPQLPSLTIRTKPPTPNYDNRPSETAQDTDGLLGYLSKGLGGIFGAARPPKPSSGVPGTARSCKSVRSVYSSRSAFQRSVYQEQMNQQMETSVNNFSKFLKDKGTTFKGKLASAMSDVGSNYDAMSAAPDSPFSTVMSTISEWNLPEHTEHAVEPHRNPARLDLSRIDRSVDTKLQLDRYLASQPSPYQVAQPSARDLEFVPEESSPVPFGTRGHNNYFAESPNARQTPSATPRPFAATPNRIEGSTTRTPPSDSKSHTLPSPPKDQDSHGQQARGRQVTTSDDAHAADAAHAPTAKPSAAPAPTDLNLASHPLAMFAALGSDTGISPVENGSVISARAKAAAAAAAPAAAAPAADDAQQDPSSVPTEPTTIPPSSTDQSIPTGGKSGEMQALAGQSTVEQQLWHALLAHNQAVIDKQDAEAKAEELEKQVHELRQQLQSSHEQLDSSRVQHSTAAQQASHLGDGLRDLQAESQELTQLTEQLQQFGMRVFDHKKTVCDTLTTTGMTLQALEQQQELEWQDYQALIVSSTATRDALTEELAHCKAELSTTRNQLQGAMVEIQQKNQDLDVAAKHAEGLASDLRQARDQCTALTEELQSSNTQLEATGDELTGVKATLAAREEELQRSRAEAAELKSELEASHVHERELESDLASSRAAEAGLRSEVAAAAQREAGLESELQASHTREADLKSELQASNAREADLKSELQASHTRETDLKSELQASNAREADLKSELHASHTREADLKSELQASNALEADLKSELQASHTREADLKSELQASNAREADLKSELQASNAREANLESELQASHTREADLKAALESSQARESQLTSTLTATRASEADLRSQLAAAQGHVAALKSELEHVIADLSNLTWKNLLQDLSAMQQSQHAVKHKCSELSSLSAALEEDTLGAATTFMEMQEDLNESEDALREVRTERQSLASRCEILKQSNARLLAEAEETGEEVRELRHERQQLTSLREIMRQENMALGGEVQKLKEGKQKAEAAEAQLAEHVTLLEKQLGMTRGVSEKLEAAKKQLDEEKVALEKQVACLQSESSSHAAAATARHTECVQLREQLELLQLQLSSAHHNMEQLSMKTGALRGAVASISADAACLLELRQQLSQQLSHGRQLTQHLNLQGEQLNNHLTQRISSHPVLVTPPAPRVVSRANSTPPLTANLPPLQTPPPPPQPGTPPRASGSSNGVTPLLVASHTPTSFPQRSPDSWVPSTPPQMCESMAQAMVQQAELIELLESEVISLQEQVLAAQEQVTSMCSCMSALQGDNASLRELNTSLQEGLSASGAQVVGLQEALRQVAEVENELRMVQEVLQGMGVHTAQAVSVWPELGEVRMKVVEVETSWQSQLEANEQLRQRMLSKLTSEQMNVSELTQQLASAESQQRQLAVQVAAAGHLRVELEHELERVRCSNSDLSRELRSVKSSSVLLESRVEEAVGELRSVRMELDQAKGERDRSAANASRLLSKHEDLQRHCNNLRNRCSELAGEVEASRRASRQVQNAVRELQNLKAELHQTEMLCSFLSRCTQTFSSNQSALINELQPIQQAWVSLLYSADSPFTVTTNNISRGKVTKDDASDPTFLPMPPARVPDQSQLNLALKGGRELVKILMHLQASAKTNPSVAKAFKQALLQVPMSPRLRRTTTPPSSPQGPELLRKRSTPLSSPVKESEVSSLSANDLAVFMKMHLDFDPVQVLKQLDASAAMALKEEPTLEQLSSDVVAAKKLLTTRLQQLLQPLRQHAHAWGSSWGDLVKMLTGEEGGDNFGRPNIGSTVADTHLQLEQLVAVTLKVLVFLCKQAAQQQSHSGEPSS